MATSSVRDGSEWLCDRTHDLLPIGGEASALKPMKGSVEPWARLGSNQRPPACEAGALPLSYAPRRERQGTVIRRYATPATTPPARVGRRARRRIRRRGLRRQSRPHGSRRPAAELPGAISAAAAVRRLLPPVGAARRGCRRDALLRVSDASGHAHEDQPVTGRSTETRSRSRSAPIRRSNGRAGTSAGASCSTPIWMKQGSGRSGSSPRRWRRSDGRWRRCAPAADDSSRGPLQPPTPTRNSSEFEIVA